MNHARSVRIARSLPRHVPFRRLTLRPATGTAQRAIPASVDFAPLLFSETGVAFEQVQ
jgi:hypothetical protein